MNRQQINVFTGIRSSRMEYIFRFILEEILDLRLYITSSTTEMNEFAGPKINYSDQIISGCLHVNPHPVIVPAPISEQDFDLSFFKRLFRNDSFFPETFGNNQDPFGFCFYVLSRYEEYLPFTPDEHGRFEASESVLYRNKWLYFPVIEVWCYKLADYFQNIGIQITYTRRYRFINTIDIDQAYSFLYKGIGRNLGGAARHLMKGDISSLRNRLEVISRKKTDPFDSFDYLENIRKRYNPEQIYFFLVGDYGEFDKNISYYSPGLKKIVSMVKTSSLIGIHPSYSSHKRKTILLEKQRLEELCEKEVTISRQHYLKLHLPDTYLELIKAGIIQDFSMGYASHPGFRAGTCHPFFWYDLINENTTSLKINPVTIMEGTLSGYQQISAANALPVYADYISVCKKYGGCFISIFHNESVSEYGKWKGWRSVYENMIQLATDSK